MRLTREGDANADGISDGSDFLTWQRQFGSGVPASTAPATSVPESSSLGLFALAMVHLGISRGTGKESGAE